MIDVRKLTYKLVAILEDGTQLDISRATEDLGWEEGEGEIAMRLSFTVHNAKYQGQPLIPADQARLHCRYHCRLG